MKTHLLWAAIALPPLTALADYQFELSGGYGQSETTTTVKTFSPVFVGGTVVFTDRVKQEADLYRVGGRLHIDTVSTAPGPLAEAAFLDRSSFVDLRYSSAEPDDSADDNTDSYHIGGRFVSDSALIVELNYADTHLGEQSDSTIRAGIGGYLNDRNAIVLSYRSNTDRDDDLDVVDATLHGVASLNNSAHLAYDLVTAYIDNGDDEGYGFGAGATVYFTPRLGLGVNATMEEVGEQERDSRTVYVSFFPADNLLLTASLFDESMEFRDVVKVEVESEGVSLGVNLRF